MQLIQTIVSLHDPAHKVPLATSECCMESAERSCERTVTVATSQCNILKAYRYTALLYMYVVANGLRP